MASNDKYVLGKNVFMAILLAIGLFSAIVLLSISWIKLVIIGFIVVSGVVWIVSHGLLRRIVKYTMFAVLLFAISFSAVEGYLFRNAGYPPTFGSPQSGVTLSYPNILDVSLTEIVQDVKDTSAFKLLMLEHPNEVRIETIKLSTVFGAGSIEVRFYQESSKLGFNFFSSGGGPYYVSVRPLLGTRLHPMFPRNQTQDALLKQIDDLGLQWYYDAAVEAYQSKTGVDLEVNELTITIQSVNHSNYPGMQLHILGMHKDGDHSSFAFSAYFHPNGTLVQGFNVN
jgi:hypothetical protein